MNAYIFIYFYFLNRKKINLSDNQRKIIRIKIKSTKNNRYFSFHLKKLEKLIKKSKY